MSRTFAWLCLIAVAALASFGAGVASGLYHKSKACPIVVGYTVMYTSSTRDGEYCVYASEYGRSLRKEKV